MKNIKTILTKCASDYFPFNMEYELDLLNRDKLYDLINSCESIEVLFTEPWFNWKNEIQFK